MFLRPRRLRAAFDLLAGYLSLLRFDARAALDGRLSLVLSSLCEALEFDQDFNVQVLLTLVLILCWLDS